MQQWHKIRLISSGSKPAVESDNINEQVARCVEGIHDLYFRILEPLYGQRDEAKSRARERRPIVALQQAEDLRHQRLNLRRQLPVGPGRVAAPALQHPGSQIQIQHRAFALLLLQLAGHEGPLLLSDPPPPLRQNTVQDLASLISWQRDYGDY